MVEPRFKFICASHRQDGPKQWCGEVPNDGRCAAPPDERRRYHEVSQCSACDVRLAGMSFCIFAAGAGFLLW